MKINIELNQKSIQQAKRQLLQVKKVVPIMTKDFLEDVALWVIERANLHLNNSDIGENVKIDIRNGWVYNFTPTGIQITNSTEKAVFVEFGVGIVGQGNSHPQASIEGYEYNVSSSEKQSDGSWHFFSDEANLDIPKSAIDWGLNGKGNQNRMSIYTRGTKGVWYAYNAIVDAQMELAKPNGGEIGALWDKAKRKYIK
jgi:hypothetical protein